MDMEVIMEILSTKIHEKKNRPVKVLQFGEGNFLRAFIDWFIQEMNDKADFNGDVCVVQPLDFGRVEELRKQDGLYTLLLEGVSNGEVIHHKQVIDVLSDFINPYQEYERYLDYAKSEDLKIILSNTTEAGIAYDPSDTDETVTSPTYPGKLLTFLKKRFDFFQGSKEAGLYILPCELIDHNGSTLKEYLNKLSLDRHYSEEFITWLNEANLFYNTLVDRIVPGYPKDQIERLQKEDGYIDNNVVKGEIFHLWVIEGDPAIKTVLPIEKTDLNILVTDNVKPYKERKVKILNGSHTCMVPIAYQYGVRAVNEMMNDEYLKNWLFAFLKEEVWPTIDLPQSEKEQFTNDVMERFMNPTIYHELLTISLNSMTKYKTRVLPSAIGYYEKTNELPKHSLFSLASLFVMYSLKKEDGTSLVMDDPAFIEMWARLWKQNDVAALVQEVMSMKDHWEYDFTQMKGSLDYVSQCVNDILALGMKKALVKHFG